MHTAVKDDYLSQALNHNKESHYSIVVSRKAIIRYHSSLFIGLFVPFARSGKLVAFCGLLSLVLGHWMSIGSMVHFSPSHLPMQQVVRSRFITDNCSWAVQLTEATIANNKAAIQPDVASGAAPGDRYYIKDYYIILSRASTKV